MLDHNVPAPAVLTVHVASGVTRTYDVDALDADAAWDAIPALWLFEDYLPTVPNAELGRLARVGGLKKAASSAWTAHLKNVNAG